MRALTRIHWTRRSAASVFVHLYRFCYLFVFKMKKKYMRTKTIIVVLIQQVLLSQYPQTEHVLSDFLPQHQRLQDELVL